MKKIGDTFELSATDLVGHLNCLHLTGLDRAVAEGVLSKPKVWNPLLKVLAERGAAHEQGYVDYLSKAGFGVVRIDGVEVTAEAIASTVAAMSGGVQVIVQGALAHNGWVGRADILRRVDGVRSALGDWSYEVVDTKLARDQGRSSPAALPLLRSADRSPGRCPGVHVCCRALVGFRAAALSLCRLSGLFPEGEEWPAS